MFLRFSFVAVVQTVAQHLAGALALQDLKSTPLATFLTVMVIAISLTLPSVCYMVYKNVSSAASQYYPSPQITVYLEKTLDDDAAARVVGQLQAEQGVDKVNYLSRDAPLKR